MSSNSTLVSSDKFSTAYCIGKWKTNYLTRANASTSEQIKSLVNGEFYCPYPEQCNGPLESFSYPKNLEICMYNKLWLLDML